MLAFMILGGFQREVGEKIYRFTGHLQVTKFMSGNAYEESPMSTESFFYRDHREHPVLRHVQSYAHKPGLIKGEEEVEGVLFKGIAVDFDTVDFRPSLKAGRFIRHDAEQAVNEVLISQKIADKLLLSLGDKFVLYFVQDPPRFRNVEIVGIYETYMEAFDEKIIIGDIQTVRNLNGWNADQVGGLSLFLQDPSALDAAYLELEDLMDYDLRLQRVKDRFADIFDWLALLNNNVYVFLGLILFVAAFNMVSVLFILIMERTPMIGLLKAIGASFQLIRRIFFWNGIRIIGKGMLIGNTIGLGLGALQDRFRFIRLDPEAYYMEAVPIAWNWPLLIGLNVFVFVLTALVLLIPARLIAGVQPIKAIRFD